MKVAVRHHTVYRYPEPAALGPHLIRLRPAPHAPVAISDYRLAVSGASRVDWQQDPNGNFIARCLFPDPMTELAIEVSFKADIEKADPFGFLVAPHAETWPFVYGDEEAPVLAPYLAPEAAGPELTGFLAATPRDFAGTVGFLVDLNRRVRQQVNYLERMEQGTLDPDETLAGGEGSCRDSGWLMVEILRHLGLAARFVSGYLLELGEDGGHDRASLHAWAEAYVPGAGWVGLDPSSGLLAGTGHVPLAATRHWREAAPVTGTASRAAEALDFELILSRLSPGRSAP